MLSLRLCRPFGVVFEFVEGGRTREAGRCSGLKNRLYFPWWLGVHDV